MSYGRKKLVLHVMKPVVLVCLLFVLWWWGLGGKRTIQGVVEHYSQPWAVFRVPDNPQPLLGLEATATADGILLCNKGDADWSAVLVQIDDGYLAAVDTLRIGECRGIALREFATESWKRMPPSPATRITHISVLATIQKRAYVSKHVP